MSMDSKVPEIRFKGFSGKWIQENISNIAPLQRGFDLPKNLIKVGAHPVVMSNGVNGFHNAFKAKAPGVVTGRSGTIGNIHYIDVDYWPHNTSLWVTNFHKNVPLFIYYLYVKLDLKRFGTGSGVPTLNRNDIHVQSVVLPKDSKEQTAIGNYFQKLDALINQHQQKHDKLSNIKKSMLEKMFPKQGETIPEIRFKGFSGEWDEIELGEEVTFINGRAYSQEELQDKGKYTVLRVGNFYTNSSWYYSDMELGDKYYADYGDLLYTWSASFGPHIWIGDKVIYHYHIWKLELSENIEKLFLLHLLDYDRAKILSGSNGSTMIHITKSAMEAKKIFIPKKDEQIIIGNYFQKLDTLINQHQQQITKLNNIKQACLSKMFI
ncbi:restriction endonuclease subunit S [Yersinia rochesterensis]|uniref:restriction endonuclease subunit S n=1 Tax=Yersinia rochesterensis TaxID=1604335 RepID=UPI0011A1EC30|nr:restriction endonuclease subunit S [Yersinia rochesterensis]